MKRGFTLLEMLIAFFLFSFISVLLYGAILALHNIKIDKKYAQDIISEFQLNHYLIGCRNLEVENDRMYFQCGFEDYEMYFVNDKLLITPGTLIVLEELDEGYFTNSSDRIMINYFRDTLRKEWIIEK